MSINIIVTEDESIVRKDIERTLKKLGYNVVGSADTGKKAIHLALSLKPDLAIMDIMLKGEMTGIEAAAEIKKNIDIPIIFLTAYADENTLAKAKITEPHGYILKPFKEVDIQTTIELAIHKHRKESQIKVENELLKSITQHHEEADHIFVKKKSHLFKINAEDILFVEAMKDYVVVNTRSEKYTIHSTMKDIEKKLPEIVFQRVHRSYIVNMDRIESIQGANLKVEGKEQEIPIGGSYKEVIGSRINLL